MSADDVEYIVETENKEGHPATISMTKKLKQCSITHFINKNNINSISIV